MTHKLSFFRLFFAITLFFSPSAYSRFSPDRDPTFDEIKSFIEDEKNKITSIEKFLSFLPSSYLHNFVLMHHSRSLQGASFENPRVIAFGRTAKLLMAFNGDSVHDGYNNLELIQYRDNTRSFEFREIKFDNKSQPKISVANPAKCLFCHQSPERRNIDPRPNWEPYNIWPGAYGTIDGQILTQPDILNEIGKVVSSAKQITPANVRIKVVEILEESRKEGTHYLNLMRKIQDHDRYKYLSNAPDFTSTYKSFFLGKEFFAKRLDGPLSLTQILAQHNFERVARIVSDHPFFDFYKHYIAGIKWESRSCDLPSFVLALTLDRGPFLPDQVKISNIEKIFSRSHETVQDWSMDFETNGRFAARNRFTTPGIAEEELLRKIWGIVPSYSACGDLNQAIEKIWHKKMNQILSYTSPDRPPEVTMVQCIGCHTLNRAPYIPFDDIPKLREFLAQKYGDIHSGLNVIEEKVMSGSMPANIKLTEVERRSFSDYMKNLMAE